jgi:hypothetical protein
MGTRLRLPHLRKTPEVPNDGWWRGRGLAYGSHRKADP